MKKVLYIFVTMLEVLCLAGVCEVQYFTRKKMGMARYVVYKNQGWERQYPMEFLTYGAVLALAVLAVAVLLFFLRRRRGADKPLLLMNLAMVLFTGAYAGFTLMHSTKDYRAYYFISAILAVLSLLQTIKTFVGILVRTYET